MINYTVMQESIEGDKPLILEMALGYENYINKLWKSNELTFTHNDKHYYVYAYYAVKDHASYMNDKLIVRLIEK
jgi:hypothetical protein